MKLVTYRMTGYAGSCEPDYGETNIIPQTFVVSSNISEEMLRDIISEGYLKKSYIMHTKIILTKIKSVPL